MICAPEQTLFQKSGFSAGIFVVAIACTFRRLVNNAPDASIHHRVEIGDGVVVTEVEHAADDRHLSLLRSYMALDQISPDPLPAQRYRSGCPEPCSLRRCIWLVITCGVQESS